MNGLLIGRFQPFHLGHLQALQFALSKVDKLWIGLGSSNKPPQKDNPFSSEQREQMILSSINQSMKERISIYPIPDLDNHIEWIEKIDSIVPKFDVVFSNDELTKHLYLKRDCQIVSIPFLNRSKLSGTNIRELVVADKRWHDLVPAGTRNFLESVGAKKHLQNL